MQRKIGISTHAIQLRYGDMRTLEICADAGFDAVDFNLERYGVGSDEVYKRPFDDIAEHFSKIGERARELGLIISQTHGRCATYRNDDKYCEFVRWVSERDLLATSALGAPACVIHSISTNRYHDATAEFMRARNREMYADLVPFAEKYKTKIALETFGDATVNGQRALDFFGDSRELYATYKSLDTEYKTLCLDTGHTNKACNVCPELPHVTETIRLFGKDLTLLHLNDNNGFTDQHLPPKVAGKAGGLNWDEIFAALDETGYSGVYNFELSHGYYGELLEDYIHFLAKYLRAVVGN